MRALEDYNEIGERRLRLETDSQAQLDLPHTYPHSISSCSVPASVCALDKWRVLRLSRSAYHLTKSPFT